ncbi:hypothetical protein YH63_010850 [Afipia massiliensis]|uniref:DUF6647 domain-containing protein n=1 Tax=Afipia massiliensis TaxID=211460 RepID=A0A4U6BSW7_9BRAD|nr:DUF6647 family protein [Afipia massiliensis]TKT71874.1 hypothetical protein YH63_010850 [Afipia massiliensis]
MTALLTAIAMWLSVNFDLPATHEPPKVELVSPAKINAIRYQAFAAWQQHDIAGNAEGNSRATVAVYDDATQTIYLPVSWTSAAPADLSVLVHEMVHHLQNIGRLKYECPAAREELAYRAQDKWLGLFGSNLEQAFDLDKFTLKVSTACGY